MRTSHLPLLLAGIACAAVGAAPAGPLRPAGGQRTVLQDVLDRAAVYVAAYEKECSAVVAEERYQQNLVPPERRAAASGVREQPQPPPDPRTWSRASDTSREPKLTGPSHRDLVSDVLLVQLPDQSWFGFRDVAIVDGHPVRDRAERLQTLFLKSKADLRSVQEESARYNIGPVRRTMNVPTFALVILHPSVRYRFAFEQAGEDVIDGTQTMIVSFHEQSSPTVVTDGRGTDVVSTGRAWIHPATGRVLRTDHVVGGSTSDVRAETVVDYKLHAEWGFLLPAEMRETYELPTRPDVPRVVCAASYSNFRRFSVSVDETIKPPR